MKKLLTAAALSAALLTALTSCSAKTSSSQPTASERDVFAMDTFMTMKAYGDGAGSALEAAEERIRELEAELAVTAQDSDIAHINRANGAEV